MTSLTGQCSPVLGYLDSYSYASFQSLEGDNINLKIHFEVADCDSAVETCTGGN